MSAFSSFFAACSNVRLIDDGPFSSFLQYVDVFSTALIATVFTPHACVSDSPDLHHVPCDYTFTFVCVFDSTDRHNVHLCCLCVPQC